MHTTVPALLHNDAMAPYSLHVANSKEPISVHSNKHESQERMQLFSGAGLLEKMNFTLSLLIPVCSLDFRGFYLLQW